MLICDDVQESITFYTDLLGFKVYGMKEFEMLDPSGHVLVFGQKTDEPHRPVKE